MSCGGIGAFLSTTTCIPSTTSTIASGYLSRRYPVLQSEILDYPPAPPDTRRGRSPDTLLARHPRMSRIDDSMRSFSSRIALYLHPSQEQRSRLFNCRSRISDRSVAASDTYASRCDIDLCSSSILYIPRFGVSTSCDGPTPAAGRGAQITRARSFLSGCCAMMAAKYLTPLLGSHFASSGSSVHRLSRQSSRHPIRFKPASHGLHATGIKKWDLSKHGTTCVTKIK